MNSGRDVQIFIWNEGKNISRDMQKQMKPPRLSEKSLQSIWANSNIGKGALQIWRSLLLVLNWVIVLNIELLSS